MRTCCKPYLGATKHGQSLLEALAAWGNSEAAVALCRTAIHCSLFALYALGGFLVQRKLIPIRVLLSAIGFTFSLVFATQGVVQTLADTRKVTASVQR